MALIKKKTYSVSF